MQVTVVGKHWKRDRHSRDAVTSRLRLRGYDYSLPGDYFVTLCTAEHACSFGHVEDDRMVLSTAGLMTDSWWHTIPRKFPTVRIDEMVVMPNHVHGILERTVPEGDETDPDWPQLPRIIQWFKSITTNDYMLGVRIDGWPRFPGTLWQGGATTTSCVTSGRWSGCAPTSPRIRVSGTAMTRTPNGTDNTRTPFLRLSGIP